jgi:hypothetical protein
MTLTLPDTFRAWLEHEAHIRGHTVDQIVEGILHREQAFSDWEAVEGKLAEALESGPATPMTAADWEQLRQRIHDRHPQRVVAE